MQFDAAQVTAATELITSVIGRKTHCTFENLTQSEFDAITGQLKREFIVEVKRLGALITVPGASPVYMRVPFTRAIGERIQGWMRYQKTFDPTQVDVADTEVLVEVRAECCGLTSSGLACACK